MFGQLLRRVGIVSVAAGSLLLVPAAHAQTEQAQLVTRAQATLSNFLRDPQMTWLQQNIGRAKAVLIAPEVVKAGFIFGGSGGRAPSNSAKPLPLSSTRRPSLYIYRA